MAQVIVHLRSIRIDDDDIAEAEVNAYYKGGYPEIEAKINQAVKERLEEMLKPNFIGDRLIDGLEVEED